MSRAARVAVVGNGPVGQTTALLLARWGIPVLLLDARSHRDLAGSKAICQQRDVLDVWQCVGAGQQIAAEGVTWRCARTFYQDRELFSYTLPEPGPGLPAFVNISQARTEELLDRSIAAQPLISVRWAHRVTGISQDGGGAVTLRYAAPGRADEVTVDHAVVCAGARCDELRAGLGVTFAGESFADRFLICDIRAELPGWANERRFYFDSHWNPGRQVLIHPCPDSTFRIDWQVPSDYDLAREEATGALDQRIRAIVGDTPYEVVWRSVYRFHSRVVDRMSRGRVFMAGDCAHLFAPFGARGLNSGVADAENIAWKLAFVLRGWAQERLLETYHVERHAAALENLAVTKDTMDFLAPRTEAQRQHRRSVLERSRADPSAHAEVNSGRLAEPFWYVDSPLTTPDQARPFTGRPPRGGLPAPGPGILLPDAALPDDGSSPTRLRRLCRNGFLLLAATETAAAVARRAIAGLPAPAAVIALDRVPYGAAVHNALSCRPGELWIVRPDAYVAAVLTRPASAQVRQALDRALGAGLR